jgi:hypothetical protein
VATGVTHSGFLFQFSTGFSSVLLTSSTVGAEIACFCSFFFGFLTSPVSSSIVLSHSF